MEKVFVIKEKSFIGLAPRVDFTNMFMHSFYARRFQKRKTADDFAVILAILGSTHARKNWT
jgi:hypothetical protein